MKPLFEVVTSIKAACEGEIGHKVKSDTKDEFGVLSRSYNQMLDLIIYLIKQTQESSRRLANVLIVIIGQVFLAIVFFLAITSRQGWVEAVFSGVFPDLGSRLRFLGLALVAILLSGQGAPIPGGQSTPAAVPAAKPAGAAGTGSRPAPISRKQQNRSL